MRTLINKYPYPSYVGIVFTLPDDAMLDVRVVSIILNRSVASIWRDAKSGCLANPIRIGASPTPLACRRRAECLCAGPDQDAAGEDAAGA